MASNWATWPDAIKINRTNLYYFIDIHLNQRHHYMYILNRTYNILNSITNNRRNPVQIINCKNRYSSVMNLALVCAPANLPKTHFRSVVRTTSEYHHNIIRSWTTNKLLITQPTAITALNHISINHSLILPFKIMSHRYFNETNSS